MTNRSIGVVSLLADKQAFTIWGKLTEELGPEIMQRHRITCGDARTFQGKERCIMFLSMVSAPNEVGAPLSRDTFAQRFNVAASRARDRMYLVRSVELKHLSEADRLRRSLIAHFANPFSQDEYRVEDLRKLCESPFEREMYDELTQRGYWVTPQVPVGQFRIDMVVEGNGDARLAIECDGDRYHGPDKWHEDMQRQRVLERAGWMFWRCFASAFIRRRKDILDDLVRTLTEHGIAPIGAEGAPRSVHVERRTFISTPNKENDSMHDRADESGHESTSFSFSEQTNSAKVNVPPEEDRSDPRTDKGGDLFGDNRAIDSSIKSGNESALLSNYTEYSGLTGRDPRSTSIPEISEGVVRIINVEGPVIAKRVYDIYLHSCGIKRMGRDLRKIMNKALSYAIRRGEVVSEDEARKGGILYSTVRMKGSKPIRLRKRGPRSFEEIPISELQAVAKYLSEHLTLPSGSEIHLRMVLEWFDLKRLTPQVAKALEEILNKKLLYVDEFLRDLPK